MPPRPDGTRRSGWSTRRFATANKRRAWLFPGPRNWPSREGSRRPGCTELEVGTPAMGDEEIAAIRAIVGLRLPCRLTAWCRASREDIDLAAACGVDAVHFSLPVSATICGRWERAGPGFCGRSPS